MFKRISRIVSGIKRAVAADGEDFQHAGYDGRGTIRGNRGEIHMAEVNGRGSGAKGRPGRKPDPERLRTTMVAIRCRPEWRDWLKGFAASRGLDMSELTAEVLHRFARDVGHEMPPER